MKVYIAGKITGDERYGEKFRRAEEALRAKGHRVLNPAVLPEGMSAGDYMRICFAMIDCADVVMFLPDWGQSGGALLESAYCRYVGKDVGFLDEKGEVVA